MTARDTLLGLLQQWTERSGASEQTPELMVAASDAELRREWAAKIRKAGTAKGWSTWAAAFLDPDIEFVDTDMPSTETIVGELRRLDRIAVLREAAAAITAVIEADRAYSPRRSNDRTALAGARQIVLDLIDTPRHTTSGTGEKDTSAGNQPTAGESTVAHGRVEPMIVSRFDVAMEAAPEEEPVFTVGAVADDGRPVALLFDPEARRRVAGWLAPDALTLSHAVSFEIPWPGRWRPLLIHRSYAGGDCWWISDREGRRWHRQLGFVYEAHAIKESARTETRFPLSEAWPLAQRIAADETAARDTTSTTETACDTAHAAEPEGPSQ
ncbi:hypothetical protein [Streptomyces sp. NPDC094468]|uniref:hypothetical protein n=1 Tax=Streptomyces sp. NPDC094468 TaxID=3366066 RepID=UPI0038092BC0